jgi:poly(A) polymerase
VREFFAAREDGAYLVGGVVRDLLSGGEISDIDVAVGDPADVISDLASTVGGRVVSLDEDRDIVRVVVPSGKSPSFVDVSRMRGGIEEDLGQRDFTVDAMALPVTLPPEANIQRSVIDPFGGLGDLRSGVIRAVSPSVFREDPVRLLRAPRLAVQLGFEIDGETETRIRCDAHLVMTVAPERVRAELLKILAEDGATASLRGLDGLDLLCRVIPELEEAKGVSQPKEHHWDVFDHLMETVGQMDVLMGGRTAMHEFVAEAIPRFESMDSYFAEPLSDGHDRKTVMKLAALLHDVAKPSTKTIEPSGRVRFLGHHKEGAETAAKVLGRLRVSRRGVELVRTMIAQHLRPNQMAPPGEMPSGKAIFRYYRDLGDAAIDTLYLSLADHLAARGPDLERRGWVDQCMVIDHILREGRDRSAPEVLPQVLDGRDLMDEFSLSPGPRIGILLNVVHEAQASGEVNTREEALELVKKELGSGEAGA